MRISCTTLESYRLWRHPENEWMSEQELIDTICGKFVPNHKVLIGQAFGAILETPDAYQVSGGYRVTPRGAVQHYDFGDDVIDPALALIDRPRTVFEAKGSGAYAGHDVIAKADQMVGARLIETKTTLGTFDFDKYAQGCQWRFMADIFGVPSVTYSVFCLSEDERNGVIRLKGIETFTLYRYAALHQDCLGLVRDFAEYVDAKGLSGVLDARQAAAA